MNEKLTKIREFTKEELRQEHIETLLEYIVKLQKVYNMLIDRVNELEGDNND